MEAVPGVVFELPGCRSGGVRREGGRFFSLGFDEREARIDELIAGSQKLVGRINADQAALAANTTELLGLFQAGQGWGWGWRTPAHRLACQLKLTGAEARRLVTAADVLPDLPQLAEAFGHGEVSLPVVAALAQVATADTEAELVEQSRHATADAMLGLVSTFKRLDAEAGDRPPRPESLSLRARADGYEIRGFLDSVNGAVLEKRLAQRRNELFDQTGTAATSADALLSLLEVGPRPVSPQFLAVLQIDVEVFRAWQETRHRPSGCPTCGTSSDVAGNGQASTGGHGPGSDSPTGVSVLHGPPVTEAELDAIHQELSACWLVSRNGHPLWISSKQRTAPPWMRTAMTVEQPCCAAAGCGRAGVLEAHHSVPFTTKPETLFDEQVFLCRFHHRALHAQGASIEFTADRAGLIIRDHRGRVMTLTGVPTRPDTPASERPEWVGRGAWTAGMGSYDAYGLDVMIAHLQSGSRRRQHNDNTPGTPGNTPAPGNRHGPPPAGGGHPADPDTTGGDNGGTSPPNH